MTAITPPRTLAVVLSGKTPGPLLVSALTLAQDAFFIRKSCHERVGQRHLVDVQVADSHGHRTSDCSGDEMLDLVTPGSADLAQAGRGGEVKSFQCVFKYNPQGGNKQRVQPSDEELTVSSSGAGDLPFEVTPYAGGW